MPQVAGPLAPIFRSAFRNADDEYTDQGTRPVVFDILAPDYQTSILPPALRMVLHVNPNSMTVNYEKMVERIQTKGGFVEQHWGEGARSIDFLAATGGFKRLYTGLSNVTGGGIDTLGTRRETIAYDKFLDLLALFHNNGSIYDQTGQIVFQGVVKITFDGGIYLGWFSNFVVSEEAPKPYQFSLTTSFTIQREILRMRSMPYNSASAESGTRNQAPTPAAAARPSTAFAPAPTVRTGGPRVTSLAPNGSGFFREA